MFLLHTEVWRACLDGQSLDDAEEALRHASKNNSEAVSHCRSITAIGQEVPSDGAFRKRFGTWWGVFPVEEPLRDVLLGSVAKGPGSSTDVLAAARTHKFIDHFAVDRGCQFVLGRDYRNTIGRKGDERFDGSTLKERTK